MIKTFAIAALLPLAVNAQQPSELLQQKLAAVPQFQATFDQQAFDFDDQLVQQSQGTVALKAPLKFSWLQQSPDQLSLVSDGVAVWYYDPYVEQVTISAIADVLEQTPLPLLSSRDPALWAQWQVSQQQQCFVLNQPQQQGVEMQVCFNGDAINKLQLIDAQGNRTVMTLTDFNLAALADDNFNFTPPEGTFIDDQRQQ
ncbi:outer membrane lipoprotein chaperone LolA [uncultured Ferrimonas sp.]|uniref:outer membrane lipoprotein chaperone LolA n=1 Tax=uncultured Ferrimonas sp. TaxID=432640 RepID=UPI0026153F70|nr:outer membrane lipoprotein chaperone LolA [uncultured Ferrimonas sp.]